MPTLTNLALVRSCVPLLIRGYPAGPGQCPSARRDVVGALQRTEAGIDTIECARTAISELFGNAVRHHPVQQDELVQVRVFSVQCGSWTRIGVTDCGKGSVQRPSAAQVAQGESARGLEVLRALGLRLTDRVFASGYEVAAWLPNLEGVREQVCRCDCIGWGHAHRRACTWLVEDLHAPDPGTEGTDADAFGTICVPCLRLTQEPTPRARSPKEALRRAAARSAQA